MVRFHLGLWYAPLPNSDIQTEIAQLEERRPPNPNVVGSTPIFCVFFCYFYVYIIANNNAIP